MKLTSTVLKRIVKEELGKFGKERDVESVPKDTDEVDADEYADTLDKQFDFAKALGLEETRLRRRLKRVAEQRRRALKKLISL